MERSEIRILVVDDEEEVRRVITMTLDQAGFSSCAVGSACEARRKAAYERFHLALVDLMLPDQTGLELIGDLNSNGNGPPVIIITGRPSVDTATEGMHRGVRDYLTKPVSPKELIAAVENLLASDGLIIDTEERFLAELGRRLKTFRRDSNMTMRELGNRSQISQAQISQIESGLSAPSLTTLFRLARALRVNLSDFMKGF